MRQPSGSEGATAAALQSTLEQMKAMEEMRRTLRDIPDVKKLERN